MATEEGLRITIAELKGEAKAVARELSAALAERDGAVRRRNEALAELEERQQALKKLNGALSSTSILIDRVRGALERERIRKEEVRERHRERFELQKREKRKELDKLNRWILDAKGEQRVLEDTLSSMEKKIGQRRERMEQVLALENEIRELEITRDGARLENDTLISRAKSELTVLNTELERVREEVRVNRKAAEEASYQKHKIDDEALRRVQDLQVYTQRVKKVWNIVFPGRNMPMLP